MGTGIMICGLNGAGKSTLGKLLAERFGYYFIDMEDLYFPKADPYYEYASPRTHEEVETLLFSQIKAHKNFVFACVKGDFGEPIDPFVQYAVLMDVPKNIRIKRVKNRSFQKFGHRMLPGGDLHRQEEGFFHLVESRAENAAEEWVQTLSCPVIRVDGTGAIEDNIALIIGQIRD